MSQIKQYLENCTEIKDELTTMRQDLSDLWLNYITALGIGNIDMMEQVHINLANACIDMSMRTENLAKFIQDAILQPKDHD